MPAEMFKVIARFQDADSRPLTGPEYTAWVMDRDRLVDDNLGSSPLNADGEAEFLIYSADIVSVDSPGERWPDLYFVLLREDREVFRSEVFENLVFDAPDEVTGRPDELTRSFGPFRVTRRR